MKTLAAAVLVALLFATPVSAGTHAIPDTNPLVIVTVPDDGWTATKIARGIELETDDDEIYVSIEAMNIKNVEQVVTEAMTVLSRGGVTIDKSTEKQRAGAIQGRRVDDIQWKGKDSDGEDVQVNLTIISLTDTEGLLVTYWASPDGDKTYEKALTKMFETMQIKK